MRRGFLVVTFFLVVIFSAGCGETTTSTTTPTQPAEPRKTFSLLEILPPGEIRVIAVVNEYSSKYQSAGNELQKSALWKERDKAMKKAALHQEGDPNPGHWMGILEKMGTTSDGNAYIVVRIAPNITLATWNNEISDINEKTLIKHGSKDYATLSNIPVHSVISFEFAINSEGKGLTERKKMIDPEFPTRFKNIRHIGPEELRKLAKIDP